MTSSLILANDAAKRLDAGERWFVAGDVVGRKPKLPGIVRLLDRRRRFLAQAFCSPGSRYFLRVITRSDAVIDRGYWRGAVQRAWKQRAQLLGFTDAVRVVHAEADGIPGVVVDKYNDVWAIQVSSSGAETIKGDLVAIVAEEFSPAGIVEKNGGAMRRAEGLPTADRVAFGTKTVPTVGEGGERFEVDVLAGQKTGAYLDYRGFRTKAAELAHGRCLDAFCYQGWFACRIAKAAAEVVAVDSSAAAIMAAKRHADINGHENIACAKADVAEYLAASAEVFDFVHLDPPSYAKGRGGLASALSGYRRLLALALPRLGAGGILMISACSHAITERILEETVLAAVARTGRKGEIVWRGIQDRDHPVLAGHPESLYLKALALLVR